MTVINSYMSYQMCTFNTNCIYVYIRLICASNTNINIFNIIYIPAILPSPTIIPLPFLPAIQSCFSFPWISFTVYHLLRLQNPLPSLPITAKILRALKSASDNWLFSMKSQHFVLYIKLLQYTGAKLLKYTYVH